MALKFIPSLKVEDIVPKGANGIKSKDKFRESIHYERYFNYLIKNENLRDYTFFDSRILDIRYGKINYSEETVNLKNESSVIEVHGSKNVYALPFVCDAFINVKRMTDTFIRSGLFIDTIYTNLEAKSGFYSLNSKYQEYMTSLYDIFIKSLSTKQKNIYNFKNFLTYFVLFLKNNCDKTPFLKSRFFESSNCSVNFSGLVIEIDTIKKDKDEEKYIKYFTSPDFINFTKLCETHGFSIDKYCPWRLVFNLKNPNSSKYLEYYNLNKDSLFNELYVRTADYDLDNLIAYMVIFYNTFILNNDLAQKSNPYITNTPEYETEITIEDAKNKFSNDFWYRLYFYILFLENKIDLEQKQYEQYVKNLSYIALNKNLDSAYSEFNNILKKHTRNNSKKFLFSF